MAVASYILPRFQAFDDYGRPMVGAKLYTYQNKTTTPAPTYQDAQQSAANTNPIVLDASGEAIVYVLKDQVYTFVLKDRNEVAVWSQDDVTGAASPQDLAKVVSDLAGEGGSALIGFKQSGTGAVVRTVQDKMRESHSPLDYGAKGDGIADDAGALELALGQPFPFNLLGKTYLISRPIVIECQSIPQWEGLGATIRYDGPVTLQPAVQVYIPNIDGEAAISGFSVDADLKARVAVEFSARVGSVRPDIRLTSVTGRNAYTNDNATTMAGLLVVSGAFDYVYFAADCGGEGCFFGPDVDFSFDRSAAGIRTLFDPTFTAAPRNIICDGARVENIWCEGTGPQEADGMSFFQETGNLSTVTSSNLIVSNYRYKNVGNRAIKLHSAVMAIVNGVHGECRSSVLPFSGEMRAAHIDAQQGGAIISNVNCIFDGVVPPFLIQNYTEQPDIVRTGASTSGVKVQLTPGTPETMVVVRHRNDNIPVGNTGNARTLISDVVVMGGRVKAVAQIGVRLAGDHGYGISNCVANTTGAFIQIQTNTTAGSMKLGATNCIQMGAATELFGTTDGFAMDPDWVLSGVNCLGFLGTNSIQLAGENAKIVRNGGSGTVPLGQTQLHLDGTTVAMLTLSTLGGAGASSTLNFGKPGAANVGGITYVYGATLPEEYVSFRAGNVSNIFRVYGDRIFIGTSSAGTNIYAQRTTSPEGSLAAPPGSEVTAVVGGTATKYLKVTGTGNTGWVAL